MIMIGFEGHWMESDNLYYFSGLSLHKKMSIQRSELDRNQAAAAYKDQWESNGA